MKTLIVDDCELSRQLLIISVEAFAETVTIAVDGHEAIEKVRELINSGEQYDLICLDLNMPRVDGHETMQAIREMEHQAGVKRAVVFMITSSNCPDDMIKAITQGECDDYLMKPVMRRHIVDLLKKHALIPTDNH